jgi:hypothetical protein
MTFPFPFVPSGSSASITYTDKGEDSVNRTTYTFSTKSLGSAAADRKIIVGVSAGGSSSGVTLNSVTVGGISATQIVATTDGENMAQIWVASVPTGATGNVVLTFSTDKGRCGIGLWAMYGASSTATDTGFATANPSSDTLNISAGGVAVGVYSLSQSTDRTTTWTNLTEDYDAVVESGGGTHSGASASFASAQTGLTITGTPNNTTTEECFVIASFPPL